MNRDEAVELRAQEVMSQARAEIDARSNFIARVVPYLYRFEELRHVERRQQLSLIRRAGARADRELPVLVACFAWLALLGAVVYFVPASLSDGGARMN